MNAHLVQTLFLLKDQFLLHNASVQTNILMILKTNFASLAHQHAILVKVIKIHAHNAWSVKIEFCKDKNASVFHPIMNLVVLHVLNVTIYAWSAYQVQHAQNAIHLYLERWNKESVIVILVIMMMAVYNANVSFY